MYVKLNLLLQSAEEYVDASIEAPPSLLPMKHYCDVTGLEVRAPALSGEVDSLSFSIGTLYGPGHGPAVS